MGDKHAAQRTSRPLRPRRSGWAIRPGGAIRLAGAAFPARSARPTFSARSPRSTGDLQGSRADAARRMVFDQHDAQVAAAAPDLAAPARATFSTWAAGPAGFVRKRSRLTRFTFAARLAGRSSFANRPHRGEIDAVHLAADNSHLGAGGPRRKRNHLDGAL